jgi:hypothetical protein
VGAIKIITMIKSTMNKKNIKILTDFVKGFLVLVFVLLIAYLIVKYFLYITSTDVQQEKISAYKNTEANLITQTVANGQQIDQPIDNDRQYIDNVRKLSEMYYTGVPDVYDNSGNLVPGVAPDHQKMINNLLIVINSPYGTEQDFLNLARVYHHGMHEFEPDLDRAERVYQDLAGLQPSNGTRLIIDESLADIRAQRARNADRDPLVGAQWAQMVQMIPTGPHRGPFDHVTDFDDILDFVHVRPVRIQDHIAGPEGAFDSKTYNDAQNTHNSQVLSTVRVSLDNLKNTRVTKDVNQSIYEIKEYINGLKDSDKKQDSLKSLEKIEKSGSSLSSMGMSEKEALKLVWNRINDPNLHEPDIANSLKETLYDELASMQEFGTTVCSTGRLTRIVDTLNGVDEDIMIKPTYAINEEMLSKSAKIRTDMINGISDPAEKEKVIAGTSATQDTFDTRLKQEIKSVLRKDYVDTGILTESKFDNEINKWIDHV